MKNPNPICKLWNGLNISFLPIDEEYKKMKYVYLAESSFCDLKIKDFNLSLSFENIQFKIKTLTS